MDKVAADMDKALEVAAKKDDVYYNRAKIIYNLSLIHIFHFLLRSLGNV